MPPPSRPDLFEGRGPNNSGYPLPSSRDDERGRGPGSSSASSDNGIGENCAAADGHGKPSEGEATDAPSRPEQSATREGPDHRTDSLI